ncbi:MAG: hypothetical protein HYV34_00570 [Candidatus Kerfeldbacteria bacterium]|nr:hypothetical protein [Candidatus Kerfeldbacteria bacterium]
MEERKTHLSGDLWTVILVVGVLLAGVLIFSSVDTNRTLTSSLAKQLYEFVLNI